MTYFVYGLSDPAEPDVIRYVGQTDNLHRRLKVHRAEPIYGPAGFWKWSVRFFGRRVAMQTIEVVDGTRQDSLDCERGHIARLEPSGRLVNGPSYRRTNRAAGVQPVVVDAFFSCLRILQLLRRQGDETRAGYIAARTADELETKFKSLRMCGPYDSFRHALNGETSPLNKVDDSIRLSIDRIPEAEAVA